MGKVRFGSVPQKDGYHWPTIEFDHPTLGPVEYRASIQFEKLEDARDFAKDTYMIITGPQRNLKYSETGDA